jgi:DNA-binding protein HU-beta
LTQLCFYDIQYFQETTPCIDGFGRGLGDSSPTKQPTEEKSEDMNKSELVENMAKAAGISKAASEKGLNGMIAAVTGALKKGDKVTLVGFGTFSVAKRAARQGRNPQTGKPMKIKAKKVAKFKPGSKLADAVK